MPGPQCQLGCFGGGFNLPRPCSEAEFASASFDAQMLSMWKRQIVCMGPAMSQPCPRVTLAKLKSATSKRLKTRPAHVTHLAHMTFGRHCFSSAQGAQRLHRLHHGKPACHLGANGGRAARMTGFQGLQDPMLRSLLDVVEINGEHPRLCVDINY